MKNRHTYLILPLIILLIFIAPSLQAQELRLSVAASITNLAKELITVYTAEHPTLTIIPNYGPSGGLAKQIAMGAPADIYISANPKWMEYLIGNGKISAATKKIFAHNSLVFLGTTDKATTGLKDLESLERIGIGNPKSVPAGQYALEALQRSMLYEQLLQSGKLAMAKDVRQALIYADRGEVDGAFVYQTDVLLARSAKVLFKVDGNLHSTITYPIGLTASGAKKEEAKNFYLFLTSDEATKILKAHGFSLP